MVKWSRFPVGRENYPFGSRIRWEITSGRCGGKKREDIRIDQRCKNQRTSTKHSRTRSLQELFLITRSEKGHCLHTEVAKKKEAGKKDGDTTDVHISVDELRYAEVVILRSLQFHHFGDEIRILRNMQHNEDQHDERTRMRSRNQMIKTTSSLYKLDPFLDNDGLVRIGGRLHKATIPFEEKHPVVIPENSHITTFLIQHYDCKVQRHQGRGMAHNSIRQAGYWIINGRSAVFSFIARCVKCCKLRDPSLLRRVFANSSIWNRQIKFLIARNRTSAFFRQKPHCPPPLPSLTI